MIASKTAVTLEKVLNLVKQLKLVDKVRLIERVAPQIEREVVLLQSFNLTANPEELAEICDRYSAHPKALQLIAALIRDDTEFQGNVGIFLHQRDWLLIRDIERAIDEMIARLGDGEQTCLSRISVYKTSEHPLSFGGISA
jgi:hypothetical protein